ncbi:hypothetical protein [Lactococcus petauri]|uniref:hypothetical protein n=1 Tax=Lactococcus petauri TaxID=1940789 RepID=UPI0038518ADF
MSCYNWELEALIEGLLLRELDFREILAVNAFNHRYVENAKKPQMKKVLNKPKEERKIINLFAPPVPVQNKGITGKDFAERQRALSLRLAKGGK